MRIPLACVADSAEVCPDGKLSIQGIFDRIETPIFPARHQRMSFVFRIEASYVDSGAVMPSVIQLRDEDGHILFQVEGEVRIPSIAPGEMGVANQIITLKQIPFARGGTYTFSLGLDGHSHDVPFQVAQQAA
jgi:hypothetical protein